LKAALWSEFNHSIELFSVTWFGKTPTDKSQIALLRQFRQALQLSVCLALFHDPIPQPLAIKSDHVFPFSMHADFERVAKQQRPAVVDTGAAIRSFILYSNHY
jgi:hypothetical protein